MKTVQNKPVYNITWVTDQLAVGCAPMSFAQLESVEEQGIDAVLNLCGEFSDLHQIETEAGFEVYYLPLEDEEAPGLVELEKTLEWLDEAIYLGKKVLIHCRHGIGRTGTVLNAYLLRRGLGHKLAAKTLKKLRSKPANFVQWWTVRKYGRKSGMLKIRDPQLEFKQVVDLSPFFNDYDQLVQRIELLATEDPLRELCGLNTDRCCHTPIQLSLVEAVHLSRYLNLGLSHTERIAVIERAVATARNEKNIAKNLNDETHNGEYCLSEGGTECPLLVDGYCVLFDYRPLQCRAFGLDISEDGELWEDFWIPALENISSEIWLAYTGAMVDEKLPLFSLPDVVSGKFIETLFKRMMADGICD